MIKVKKEDKEKLLPKIANTSEIQGTKEKARQIIKEQHVEMFEQGRKVGKGDFFYKSISVTQGVNAISNMRHLHFTACDFMVYKDCKTDLNFSFLISITNFRT